MLLQPEHRITSPNSAGHAELACRVEDLFPAELGPAVILGNAQSIFPHQLAAQWRSYGIDVRIVSHWPFTLDVPNDETPILDGRADGSLMRRAAARVTTAALRRIEKPLLKWQADRARRAVGHYQRVFGTSQFIGFALSLPALVRSLNPQFVFGMEAFSYGLSTAWCSGVPRILQPWGSDIYLYAETTSLASLVVTHALRNVDLLVPGSIAAAEHIQHRFGVPQERIEPITWGVDLRMFSRADEDARSRILARYGIPPGALIVMNVRRFLPLWGAEIALEAFIRFARARSDVYFVLLGGAATEEVMARARRRLQEEGVVDRFVLLEGHKPLADCAQLMSVADIAVSLMYNADMRSSSVCQAVAAGAALVLSESAEFRKREALGFRAAFVDAGDVDQVLAALHRYADQPELRRASAESNRRYVEEHEDWDKNHVRLLELIAGVCRRCHVRRQPRLHCKRNA
jgi:glycosyltransferase involved in cell wall biosynthesis